MPRMLAPQPALLAAAALWALSYPVTVGVLDSMPPDDLIAARFTLAAALVIAVRPQLLRGLTRTDLVDGVVLGLLMLAAIVLQTVGLQHVSESTSGFLISLFVVLTPVISWLLLRHRIDAKVWAGVMLATGGVAVIAWHGLEVRPGVAVTLVSAVAWSLHLIANSSRSTPQRAVRLAVVQLVAGAVAATAFAIPDGVVLPHDARGWAGLGYLVVAATVVCFLLQTWAQGAMPATQAAVLLTCEPVFIALFAALAGRPPTAREVIGGALVVLGMLVIEAPTIRSMRRPALPLRRERPHRRSTRVQGSAPRRQPASQRPAGPTRPGRPQRLRRRRAARANR